MPVPQELTCVADVEPPIASSPIADALRTTSIVDYSGHGCGPIDAMVAAFQHYADDLEPIRPRKKRDEEDELPVERVPVPKPYQHDEQEKTYRGPKLANDYLVEEL